MRGLSTAKEKGIHLCALCVSAVKYYNKSIYMIHAQIPTGSRLLFPFHLFDDLIDDGGFSDAGRPGNHIELRMHDYSSISSLVKVQSGLNLCAIVSDWMADKMT